MADGVTGGHRPTSVRGAARRLWILDAGAGFALVERAVFLQNFGGDQADVVTAALTPARE